MDFWKDYKKRLKREGFSQQLYDILKHLFFKMTVKNFLKMYPEKWAERINASQNNLYVSEEDAIAVHKIATDLYNELLFDEKIEKKQKEYDELTNKLKKLQEQQLAEVSTIGREMPNDDHTKRQIEGYVYEEKTNKPVEGFTVKAFIVSKLKEDEYIGNARTDSQGRFIIQYRKTDFVVNILESFSEGGPDIILSIYNHEGNFFETTPKRSGASRFEKWEILIPTTALAEPPQTLPGGEDQFGLRFENSRLMGALQKSMPILNKSGIETTIELRRLSQKRKNLENLGLDAESVDALTAFSLLSKVFSYDVVIVLQNAAVADISNLKDWSTNKFKQILQKAGMDEERILFEASRFDHLRFLIDSGTSLEEIDGLTLDIGSTEVLSKEDKAILQEEGVETLQDWTKQREQVKLHPDTAVKLDAYARLNGCCVPRETAESLISSDIVSALDLVRLIPQNLASIVKSEKLSNLKMRNPLRYAREQLADTIKQVGATRIYGRSNIPDWMDPSLKIFDKKRDFCKECSEEVSVFSRFAYFIYLVACTGLTLIDLDKELHQELRNTSPESGVTLIPQIEICIEVLQSAYPAPLTHQENLKFACLILAGKLRLLSITMYDFAQEMVDYAGELDINRLQGLLDELLNATESIDGPDFNDFELKVAEDVVDKLIENNYRPRFIDEVDSDPNFANMPASNKEEEVDRRLHELVYPIRLNALPVLRERYRKRSRVSCHRELSDMLFIETNLGTCEMITRLDQAIRSIQAYLSQKIQDTMDSEERKKYQWLDYKSWRAEKMAEYFPEHKALCRDDVLTGERDPWDRGSIIYNRAENYDKLITQLKSVASAVEEAFICKENEIETYKENPSLLDELDNKPATFKTTPYYQKFFQGLDAIDRVLNADNEVQIALNHMDQFQPGLAVSSLNRAITHLDILVESVFPLSSNWKKILDRVFPYQDVIKISPEERRGLLSDQLYELLLGKKHIFFSGSDDPVQIRIDDNIPGGNVFELDPFWNYPAGHYRIAGKIDGPESQGHIIKVRTSENTQNVSHCRYRFGHSSKECKISVSFKVHESRTGLVGEAITFETGELIGVGARMDNQNHGYRLVIKSKMEFYTYVDEDGSYHNLPTVNHYLVLQMVNNISAPNEVAHDLDGIAIETGVECILSLEISTYRTNQTILEGKFTNGLFSRNISYINTHRSFSEGTFLLVASESIGAEFGPIMFELKGFGYPPFYAARRQALRHSLSGGSIYGGRSAGTYGMAVTLNQALIVTSDGVRAEKLFGLFEETQQLFLLFKDGASAVSLGALDTLLDNCLALSFYLRYAVIPTRMAQAYLQSGEYERAIDLLHIIYDETAVWDGPPLTHIPHVGSPDMNEVCKAIYPCLDSPPESFTQSLGADVRLFRLRLAEVYLEWADWLFRKNTSESKFQARQLYEKVLALHGDKEHCACNQMIGEITQALRERLVRGAQTLPELSVQVTNALQDLAQQRVPGNADEFLKEISGSESDSEQNGLFGVRVKDWLEKDREEYFSQLKTEATIDTLKQKSRELILEAELRYLSGQAIDPMIIANQSIVAKQANAQTQIYPSFLSDYRSRAIGVLEDYYKIVEFLLCIPPNPLLVRQKEHACSMLDLLWSCRNILGFSEGVVPPLRFEVLLNIANNFTSLALAAERDLLNFRQAFEQESFSLVEANQNLALSDADVELENMNISLAAEDIILATTQYLQTLHSVQHFETLITEGLSSMEELALGCAWGAAIFSGLVVPLSETWKEFFKNMAAFLSSVSNAAGMQASYERRKQEWEYQLSQNRWGAAIASKNITTAMQRHRIALQHGIVATMKREFAEDTIRFLHHKFLNKAMWVWMQRVIRDQYRTRLDYANVAAYLAQRALAFELQQKSMQVIRFDYFDPKRDGLLGATQLQTDLATLEDMKIAFTQRKLQISKTISLAQIMPIELQKFKQGQDHLRLGTLMEWFDWDYPGHYLRLIKSVKVTVVALVPPISGIKATLRNSGISRVVVGPPYSNQFKEETIRRNPESISLSSPYQETGLFVLDYKDDLLLPFEGSGVATDWILELPKISNRFDFSTIFDVQITIDYTALHSDEYRAQVVQRLDSTLKAERAFSFRYQFPDQWYNLNNPEQSAKINLVSFEIRREDFPSNVDHITIQFITLYFITKRGVVFDHNVTLFFKPDSGGKFGGEATPVKNLISTRTQSVLNWAELAEKEPIGTWELSLPNTEEVNNLFKASDIEDILIVITFKGKTQPWPR